MRIICLQPDLAKTLSTVSKALGVNASLPVLSNIKITANAGAQTITCEATNLEISIKATMPAEIPLIMDPEEELDRRGSDQANPSNQVLLPGKQLTDIVRSFSSGRVELTTNESGAAVKCNKSNFKLPVMPVIEFPDIKEPQGDSFTISADTFLEAIKRVAYAADPKGERLFVQSILFDIDPDKLTVVATDGNRIATQNLATKGGLSSQVMVPVTSLKKITDVISASCDDNDTIQIHISGNQLFVTTQEISIVSQLMSGQYPRYQQVIPQEFSGQMIIKRYGFVQNLERASLVDLSARLQFIPERFMVPSLNISNNKDGSQFEEEIDAKQFGSPDFNDGFNVKYLLDFLKSVDSDTVELNYTMARKPIVIRCPGDESCLYLVMPLVLPGGAKKEAS